MIDPSDLLLPSDLWVSQRLSRLAVCWNGGGELARPVPVQDPPSLSSSPFLDEVTRARPPSEHSQHDSSLSPVCSSRSADHSFRPSPAACRLLPLHPPRRVHTHQAFPPSLPLIPPPTRYTTLSQGNQPHPNPSLHLAQQPPGFSRPRLPPTSSPSPRPPIIRKRPPSSHRPPISTRELHPQRTRDRCLTLTTTAATTIRTQRGRGAPLREVPQVSSDPKRRVARLGRPITSEPLDREVLRQLEPDPLSSTTRPPRRLPGRRPVRIDRRPPNVSFRISSSRPIERPRLCLHRRTRPPLNYLPPFQPPLRLSLPLDLTLLLTPLRERRGLAPSRSRPQDFDLVSKECRASTMGEACLRSPVTATTPGLGRERREEEASLTTTTRQEDETTRTTGSLGGRGGECPAVE